MTTFNFKAKLLTAAPLAEGAEQRLRQNMMHPLEAEIIGDYELHLIGSALMPYPQLALQREGRDFTDLDQQFDETPRERGKFSLPLAKSTINKWLEKYKGLFAATHDPSKLKAYKVLLTRLGFKPEIQHFGPVEILFIAPQGSK